ncbi:lipoate--protein ligase family protein [Microbulbifer sp. S227A]|uniref:lipoate--protein ligase family protein n=1 Tax=Microbulbifer sp. S227A TaxID=3415131 RepID=UPI003C7ADCA8
MKTQTTKSASQGITRETTLLEKGSPATLLWSAKERAIAIPRTRSRSAGFAGLSLAAARAGWPLVLRSSGGGAVPQGPGTLNLAMIAPMPKGATIQDGYRLICGAISEALTGFGIASDTGSIDAAFCDGDWNVTARGLKLAGTAQRWRPAGQGRSLALIHAAIIATHPPASVWPVLERVETQAGGITPPRPEMHVSLDDLLPDGTPPGAFQDAVMRAANDRIAGLAEQAAAKGPAA